MRSSVPGVGDLSCEDLPERGMKFAAINAEWSASEDYRMAGCFRFAGELSRR